MITLSVCWRLLHCPHKRATRVGEHVLVIVKVRQSPQRVEFPIAKMVKCWFMDNDEVSDQRLEHHRTPPEYCSIEELFKRTGVEYYRVRRLRLYSYQYGDANVLVLSFQWTLTRGTVNWRS